MAWRQMCRGSTTHAMGPAWNLVTLPANCACHSKPEDPSHFILDCPFLAFHCQELLSGIPSHVRSLLPDIVLDAAWLFCWCHAQMWMDQGPCNTILDCELFRPTPHVL